MNEPNRKIRLLGGIAFACGLFLSGAMGWLILWLGDVIAHPGSSSRWNGGPEFTVATFRLFYSVLFFGGVSLVSGLFQMSTGRRGALVPPCMLVAWGWLVYSLWALLSLDKTL